MACNWFVLRTYPRAEHMAANRLERDGFEVYFPQVKAVLPRLPHAKIPLFPGYLFLRCDPNKEGWPRFSPAHHVSGWVNFEGVVPSLPTEVVEELMGQVEAINGGGGIWKRFQPGERVQVVSSSEWGWGEVVNDAKSPDGRVKVLLRMMGRLVPAQIPWENLRPMENEPMEPRKVPRRTRGGGRWIQGHSPQVKVQR